MTTESLINSYAHLFLVICSCASAITGFKYRKVKFELRFLYLYPLISFIQVILVGLLGAFDIDDSLETIIIRYSILAFILGEFLLLNNFFILTIINKSIKLSLRILSKFYMLVWFIYVVFTDSSYQHPVMLYLIQAFAMLIPGVLYFVELLHRPNIPQLSKDSSFWVTIGVMFFSSCTLPLFLFSKFVFDDDAKIAASGLYSINLFAYGILFLLIRKAYLCPKSEIQL